MDDFVDCLKTQRRFLFDIAMGHRVLFGYVILDFLDHFRDSLNMSGKFFGLFSPFMVACRFTPIPLSMRHVDDKLTSTFYLLSLL